MTTDETTGAGASRWGLWDIFRNVVFGVVVGIAVIVVSIVKGQPLGIVVGLFMMAVGGFYAWRARQGRQNALRNGRSV